MQKITHTNNNMRDEKNVWDLYLAPYSECNELMVNAVQHIFAPNPNESKISPPKQNGNHLVNRRK